MKDQIKVTFAMIIAMLFWGISFIWSEQALAVYDPFTLVLFRLIISTGLLFGINIWLKKISRIDNKDIFRFTLLAFLQPFAYFIGENYGIILTDSTTTSVVIATIPLFSPIAAYFFLNFQPSILYLPAPIKIKDMKIIQFSIECDTTRKESPLFR